MNTTLSLKTLAVLAFVAASTAAIVQAEPMSSTATSKTECVALLATPMPTLHN
jgi:hypothetical protein